MKEYVKWIDEETNALKHGVVKYDNKYWKVIKASNPIFANKTELQLKNKLRNCFVLVK